MTPKEKLMEEKKITISVPLFLKQNIELAAYLEGMKQEAWVEKQIHLGLNQISDVIKEANRLSLNFVERIERQNKYASEV